VAVASAGHVQVCISRQTDNHASTSPLSFLQARCPSCRPTNSVKALKAIYRLQREINIKLVFMKFSMLDYIQLQLARQLALNQIYNTTDGCQKNKMHKLSAIYIFFIKSHWTQPTRYLQFISTIKLHKTFTLHAKARIASASVMGTFTIINLINTCHIKNVANVQHLEN